MILKSNSLVVIFIKVRKLAFRRVQSVRPNRTWSRCRYLSRPAGEALLARWNNGDFVQNNACGRGVMTKTERSATRGFSCQQFEAMTQDTGTCALSSSGRAERRVLVLLNMEASPAQLREESFPGPTSLKTASVIAVMPMESLLILRKQAGKHRKKLLKFEMYDNLSSRFDEGRFGSYHRPFYQNYTNKTLPGLASQCQ